MASHAIKSSDLLRPTVYMDSLAAMVVQNIANGATLTATCSMPGFPTPWVLRRWCGERPDFAEALNMAQEVRAAVLVDQAQDIADDASNDYIMVLRPDGRYEEVVNHANVQRSKLKVEVRKWVAGRLHRAAWGDSKQVDINAKVLTMSMTDEQLDEALAKATDKLRLIGPQVIDNVE